MTARRALLGLAGGGLLLLAACATTLPPGAATADSGGGITVTVMSYGAPVAGIPVRARLDDGSPVDTWTGDMVTTESNRTDAQGQVVFRKLGPGRYVVIANCSSLPGDWIAGNYSTKVDVVPGRTATTTLTLRQGGHIVGRVEIPGVPFKDVAVRTETPNALSSGCPVLVPSGIDSTGGFTVSKVPTHATCWVKASIPIGQGDLSVWQDFHLEKPDTVSHVWTFPSMAPADLGTAAIRIRMPGNVPVERGHIELIQVHVDPSWRYQASFNIADGDTVTLAANLPPGAYMMRAWPEPGVKTWWNVSPDSLQVRPGETIRKDVPARPRGN